ncbi:hypothetical protein C8F04DRAFT_609550 [Mycena alexandri]|uniref:Protein kinase domain-containing protein n=1 Tax=Mycena alexandri TaxID=1745969 RepID=A0AAD6X3S1_9AGAR|nr:hypothetical protein C8F04DRAFT_609550 [Mycena alexandri]
MEASSEAELPRHDSEFSSYGGGIFSGSHHFTVAGGTFKNITNYVSAPEVPPDLRMIPMGDIDLQREIRVSEVRTDEDSGVIFREARGCVRRVYSAKVEGRKADVTVAIYEGEAADEWRRDIAKHMMLRHPHILQVCGAASSGRIHATLFHGDLIPYQQFLDPYRHSPVLTAYIHGYVTAQYWNTLGYIFGIQGCAFWIRRSSGLLCAEISPPPQSADTPLGYFHWVEQEMPNGELLFNLSIADQEVIAVRHLSLQQYHACSSSLALFRYESISTSATITFGAVVLWPIEEQFGRCNDPACVQDVEIISGEWEGFPRPPNAFHMADGSTRFNATDVSEKTFELYFFQDPRNRITDRGVWLSQANHIFHRLQVIDNYLDYVMVRGMHFKIEIQPSVEAPPPGYLFLCPPNAFQAGSSSLRWPNCPSYWSLDPLGVECLTAEEATRLGFPFMLLTTSVLGHSWDASVYTGLRQFHAAKGFDPDSQDVARHLGYPLYELSVDIDVPFAHVVDEDPIAEVSSGVEDGRESLVALPCVICSPFSAPLFEATLESTEPFNILEPSMSRTFNLISSIKLVLILFLVLCHVYEMVG